MHLRVTRGSFDPTKSDDVLKETQAVNAVITRRPGCQALQGGMDRKSGVLVVISTWDDGEAANFSRESLGEPFERMVALGVQFQPPEVYEAID
ncbi:hypothetical protein [Pseudonocardia acidicola]|uniref:ABM domain-containing protein n=1 Tax=Pseudonocardia acidicola TaxID=2724939 RepID=A0ABX1SLK2_9PSEU|nr:hypothetical protein [Pseudonocardia acidicola]NMI01297.1 hypothetical protein [Pseudonocardia acidicola]